MGYSTRCSHRHYVPWSSQQPFQRRCLSSFTAEGTETLQVAQSHRREEVKQAVADHSGAESPTTHQQLWVLRKRSYVSFHVCKMGP